jgi:ribosomal protein L24
MSFHFKTKLKAGDWIKVISGRYSGGKRRLKKGEKREKTSPLVNQISRIDYRNKTVYLKGVQRVKYDKSTPESKKESRLKEILIPVHISNVVYYLKEKKVPTKIGYHWMTSKTGETTHFKKARIARKYLKEGKNILID